MHCSKLPLPLPTAVYVILACPRILPFLQVPYSAEASATVELQAITQSDLDLSLRDQTSPAWSVLPSTATEWPPEWQQVNSAMHLHATLL